MIEIQFKQAIQKDLTKLEIEAIQQQFNLDEQGARLALKQYPGGVREDGYSTFMQDRSVNFVVDPASAEWYSEFSVAYHQKRTQQQQTARKVAQQQQENRQSLDQDYLKWNRSMSQTPPQRTSLAALEKKISTTPKKPGEKLSLAQQIQRRVDARTSELFQLTGQPVTADVQRGIRNEALFKTQIEAQEIVLVGKTLTPSERTALSSFYSGKLNAQQREKIAQQADAIYQQEFQQKSDPKNPSWCVIRDRLLTQYYADIAPVQQPSQQTLSSQLGSIPFDKQGVTASVDSAPVKASPVDTFKQKLSNNALNRLQNNSDRLNSDLKEYKNLSPNNPKW